MTSAKKIVALLLCLVLIFSCVSMGVSAASKKTNYPVIYIPGFMCSDILSDKNDPESTPYWPLQTDNIVSAVTMAVPALAKLIIKQDWDEFGEALVPVVEKIFTGMFNGKDGEPQGESGTYSYYPTKEEIKYSDEVTFRYDWRRDPIDVAKELNKFINHVIKVSGQKKVSISSHSQGGVITLAYLTLYGSSKIHGVAFDSSGIYGQSFNGNLLSGNFDFEGEALLYTFENMLKGNDYELLVDSILEILEEAGLMDAVANLGDNILDKIRPYLYQSLAALFACWPSIWAMVPDEQIDEAMNFVFTEMYDKNDPDSKKLIKKIKNYNKKIRSKREETLLALDETSKVIVIARYGFTEMPLTPAWDTYSDGTVDLAYASFGATTPEFGKTFSEDYLATANKKYISPDRTIDASTCLFPEKTWFIRDLQHSTGGSGIDPMLYKLFDYEKEGSVRSFKKYPRFMKYDMTTETIVPDDEIVEIRTPEGDMKDKIIFFGKSLLNTVKILFTK